MSINAAHNRWWQIFEVVLGIPFLVAIALQLVIPLSLPRGSFTPVFISVGAVLFTVGVIFVSSARREFAKHIQPTDPGLPTSKVVTTGVFSISRNPLYLGGICVLTGIALAVNLPWFLILLLPALIACHYILIMPEEKYLTAKFGERYHTYVTSVHRWVGRVRRLNR